MLVKTLRFLSLVCAALVLGLTLTHNLEIPGKHLLSGAEWLAVQQTFDESQLDSTIGGY